jgi:hypothetical protein
MSSAAICVAADPAPTRTGVVALARTGMPDSIDLPESAAVTVEEMVTQYLRKDGFEVIPSSEFDTVWRGRLEESGGYFDIVSGLPDLEKRRALRASAMLELNELYGVRFLLRPELVIVAATYSRGKASWDGARETAAPTGAGEVPALSLAVSVEDLAGQMVGRTRAGIQLLAKHSIWNGKYGPVPKEKLLTDDKLLRKVIDLAMTAACQTVRTAPTSIPRVAQIDEETTVGAVDLRIEPPPEGAKVVALRAFRLPGGGVTIPPDIRQQYLDILRERLEERGWWILPPEAYEQTARQVALEVGGIYDPITGEEQVDRRVAVHSTARKRVAQTYGAVAFATAGILVRPARIAGEKASWDGVSEKVADIAAWKRLLTTTGGTTKGLSFGVVLEDPDGTPRHTGWGGIQLADRLERDRFVHVPPEELFADLELARRAVDLALRGWPGEQKAPSEGGRQ